jgi:hypothetical protein
MLLKKITSKLLKAKKNTQGRGEELMTEEPQKENPEEKLQLLEEYSQIKENPMELSGDDFDRAFAFLQKYPDSLQAQSLIEEMNNTSIESLKGLSAESAVNILSKIPDHPGAETIIQGMYHIEKDYINKLISDVLIFMLEIAPEHPHANIIAQAIVEKNFTNAYNFITRNPEHPQSKEMIREMFKKDPNIAILLLQEKMDHPQMASIMEGIYDVNLKDVGKLTPNAVIFILEIAPDHQYAEKLIDRLVEENYVKAFAFIKEHIDHPNAEMMVNAICKRKPELKKLF